ncbi:hypothetical protein L1765_03630 [Microaerobacter geothermalis]|nr:hypothetical protein [Microaerobacter geothermalis]
MIYVKIQQNGQSNTFLSAVIRNLFRIVDFLLQLSFGPHHQFLSSRVENTFYKQPMTNSVGCSPFI